DEELAVGDGEAHVVEGGDGAAGERLGHPLDAHRRPEGGGGSLLGAGRAVAGRAGLGGGTGTAGGGGHRVPPRSVAVDAGSSRPGTSEGSTRSASTPRVLVRGGSAGQLPTPSQ